ncbi:MAG: undecaprenyl-diphosphate phosphatase [Alphaproteobacteria bacterium]|nr:MAG: undecaprenyl-diphosphate phosphatase [Alphaproteobacteria bacterium]
MADLKAIFIQSVTEFLPVSSSAHLTLFTSGHLAPDLLHFGTLITVVIYFRNFLLQNFFKVCIGSLPAVAIGFAIKKILCIDLYDPQFIKWGLLFGTIFMLFAEFTPSASKTNISIKNAFLIGLMQCFAFIPGFSRLGATLSAARILGYNRQSSAIFSFLLSIPASLGALVLSHPSTDTVIALSPYILLESAIGYIALAFFMKCHGQFLILALAFYRMLLFYMML